MAELKPEPESSLLKSQLVLPQSPLSAEPPELPGAKESLVGQKLSPSDKTRSPLRTHRLWSSTGSRREGVSLARAPQGY